jgi:putative PIN family toxin of toxin-antitoxin system
MIRFFVFDTNALISAHLKESSPSAHAFDKAMAAGTIVFTAITFNEFATRFARQKFQKYMPDEDRAEAIARLKEASLFFAEPTIEIKACRDRDDDKFLSLAVAVGAQCIATGDGKLQ